MQFISFPNFPLGVWCFRWVQFTKFLKKFQTNFLACFKFNYKIFHERTASHNCTAQIPYEKPRNIMNASTINVHHFQTSVFSSSNSKQKSFFHFLIELPAFRSFQLHKIQSFCRCLNLLTLASCELPCVLDYLIKKERALLSLLMSKLYLGFVQQLLLVSLTVKNIHFLITKAFYRVTRNAASKLLSRTPSIISTALLRRTNRFPS